MWILSARATRRASSTRTTRCCAWCSRLVRIPCLVCFHDRCFDGDFRVQASTTMQMAVTGMPFLTSIPRQTETLRLLRLRRSRLALRPPRQTTELQLHRLRRRQRGRVQVIRRRALPLVHGLRAPPARSRSTRLHRNTRAARCLDPVCRWHC
jgi:hypothetical protein